MASHHRNEGPEGGHDRALGEIEEGLARYVDALTAGKSVDRMQVLLENPGIGHEILVRLEQLVGFLPESDPSMPLATVGDYTLRRQIGHGGMGVVYDAWQNSMDRRVALKVLPVGVAADPRACARFMREAQAAGRLSHQNVVHVHGVGVEEKTPYFAMLTGQSPPRLPLS